VSSSSVSPTALYARFPFLLALTAAMAALLGAVQGTGASIQSN